MPLRLMLYFALLTPLLGLVQVERGAYAPSVNAWGEPNGATYAFVVYALCALLGVALATRGSFFRTSRALQAPKLVVRAGVAVRYAVLAIFVNGALCAATLLLFGGLSVLSGEVGKGEFRTTLGGFGALAYLTLKWLAPVVFAFGCALYGMAGRPRSVRLPLVAVGALTFVTGFAWGFKTNALLVLLPGLMLLLWFKKPRSVILLGCAALASILFAFQLFDTLEGTLYDSALQFVLARLTVFQGDVSWYIWGLLTAGEELPDYWITPFVAIGDRLFSLLTGITRDSGEEWILAHYGSLLTYTAGYSMEGIEAGHNVTGTPFSEGLIALGIAGVPVFGLAAGLVTGVVYRKISNALRDGRPLSATLWSNYAVWCVFAWLNGGEIVQLFHVSVLFGALASRLLLILLATTATPPLRLPAAHPAAVRAD